MKIYYDSKANALDIVFKKGKSHETRKIGSEMFVDVDKNGDPLSLEILGVNEKMTGEDFNNLSLNIANYPKGFGKTKQSSING